MRTVTGYLTAVENPHFSGLATVTIRTRRRRTRARPGRTVTAYTDAGYGVRQLVAAFGDGRGFSQRSGELRARFAIDDLGLLTSVTLDGREG